jgi:hypothetical protein
MFSVSLEDDKYKAFIIIFYNININIIKIENKFLTKED